VGFRLRRGCRFGMQLPLKSNQSRSGGYGWRFLPSSSEPERLMKGEVARRLPLGWIDHSAVYFLANFSVSLSQAEAEKGKSDPLRHTIPSRHLRSFSSINAR